MLSGLMRSVASEIRWAVSILHMALTRDGSERLVDLCRADASVESSVCQPRAGTAGFEVLTFR